ncbi:MAG: hypothetical protein H7A37_00065 [Chlamydiales bacterium]|nr:hypothetical protein [Chlamydiia bacterium]MCP5506688.1 hypothetical protein [Chlamydiales bacterium]
MSKPILSKRKADAISNGIFLIALGILFYTNSWWPGILLAIWATLATRQFLTGRRYDLAISSVILISLFLLIFFQLDWTVIVPVLFTLGGIYIIFREYFYSEAPVGEDRTEAVKHNLEDAIEEENE